MLALFTPVLIKITTAICLIFGAAYIFLKKKYRFWKDQGVPGPEPMMVLGNMREAYSLKYTEPDMMDAWYKEYRNEPYIGFYNMWKPTLFVLDPEIIKKITEANFNHFTDHPQISGNSDHDAVIDSLFTQKGARWKVRRQFLSRLFTPRKLRQYSEVMSQYSSTLLKDIQDRMESNGEIKVSQISNRHVIRTIASVLYSLDLSQDEERTTKISEVSEVFARPPVGTAIKFMLYTVAPNLFTLLGLKTFPGVLWDYFSKLTTDLMDHRNKTNQESEDLIGLVSQLQKEGNIQTEDALRHESVGHIFSFFIAGHHTSLTTLSFVLFELSRNVDVQEKLRNEIDSVLIGKEDISYDTLKKMTYLDDVINETLRLHPLLGVLKRLCTKEYKIDDKLTIPQDTDVYIPVQSIHMDPEYFSEPEKFQPERFSVLEKLPFMFMPFGKGPRICIGLRLAYISLKIALAKIISEYMIFESLKTELPIVHDPKTVVITVRPLQELWVRFEKRENPHVAIA